MPIPVVNDHYAAQIIFTGKSGAPEDVYTNTFYFRNDDVLGDDEEVADRLADNLLEFYNATQTNVVGGAALASYMSGAVINAEAQIRVYDLGNPAPRYPLIRFRTLTGLASTALPSEVAVCLSYVAQQNQPRMRGRIYLGPLAVAASAVQNGRGTVAQALSIGLLGSAKRMIDDTQHTWSLWSPTDGVMKPITGCWVDNAFDTQRRRGEKAFSRYTIGTYLGQQGTAVPTPP